MSSDFLSLAATFASKVGADNAVSKLLDNLELIPIDVHVHSRSICQALRNSWHFIAIAHGLSLSASVHAERRHSSFKRTDFESSLLWAQITLDFAWTKLNSGSWQDVGLVWRKVYATAALFKAISLLSVERAQEALSEIDKGILLGAPVFDDALKSFASTLSHQIQQTSSTNYSKSYMHGGLQTAACQADVQPASKYVRIGKIVLRNYSSFHEPSSGSIIRVEAGDCSCANVADPSTTPRIDMTRRITVATCPSLEEFYCRYMMKSVTVVISGAMDHWPAYSERKWSLEYLKRIAGPRTVPVELGSQYTSSNWSQKLMTLSDFIDTHVATKEHEKDGIGYLAQHHLFDQIPELKDDIAVPEYCYLRSDQEITMDGCTSLTSSGDLDHHVKINAWFGPSGTVSPLHHDPEHNLLCQVVGRKYIRIFDTAQGPRLYPHQGLLSNTSQVDCEAPDLNRFPLFCSAKYSEFILHPGQMLYIPPKHWHYVRALDVSFSVSFWWN